MWKYLSVLSACVLMFSSCDEVPPVISSTCDTNRVVLIEEFTGVKCVNCPTGSERVEQLLEQHKGKLIAISIHSGFFSKPYTQSVEDFTTAEGQSIDAMLGPVTSYPAASINRRLFQGESELPLGLSSWAGYIVQELCKEAPLNIAISNQLDVASRVLDVDVTITPASSAESLSEELGLTVLITEDSIVSAQETLEGVNNNYVHKHVLRAALTDYRGKTINTAGTMLGATQESLQFTLAPHWRIEKCHVIAFVHRRGSAQDILQAAEIKLEK